MTRIVETTEETLAELDCVRKLIAKGWSVFWEGFQDGQVIVQCRNVELSTDGFLVDFEEQEPTRLTALQKALKRVGGIR